MRKAILRSLSLAVGLTAAPAWAQDARAPQTPVRGARLGLPLGSTDAAVTPAGLLMAAQDPTAGPPPAPVPIGPLPTPTAAPPVAPPPNGTALMLPAPTPLAPALQGTPPGPMQIGPPTPLPGTPNVTEVRNPGAAATAPSFPGYPIIDGNVAGVPFVPEGGFQPGTFPPDAGPCPTDCPTGTKLDRLMSGNHFYAGAEYLMWWTKSQAAPPLLSTSPPGSFGILGAPGSRVIYGGGDIGDTLHGGARFTLGDWFGCDSKWGIEGRVFFLGDDPSTFTATSGQYPVLARPFYNLNTPTGPFSELVAYPGLATGLASVKTQTELWGAEANVRRVLFGSVNNGGFELDAIMGYRFLDLDQRLTIQEDFFRTPGSPMSVGTPATSGNVTDVFHTRDLFNGGQIGLNASYQYGPWFIESRATVAFGNLEQEAFINGGQTLYFASGAVGKYQGGLLALPGANIGTWRHSEFAVLPEVTLNVGYQITSHVRVFVGYDFLYLGNTLQPGDTVPTAVDAARIPNFPLPGSPAPLAGAPRPGPSFHTSDFFAQGLNFGVQVKW